VKACSSVRGRLILAIKATCLLAMTSAYFWSMGAARSAHVWISQWFKALTFIAHLPWNTRSHLPAFHILMVLSSDAVNVYARSVRTATLHTTPSCSISNTINHYTCCLNPVCTLPTSKASGDTDVEILVVRCSQYAFFMHMRDGTNIYGLRVGEFWGDRVSVGGWKL